MRDSDLSDCVQVTWLLQLPLLSWIYFLSHTGFFSQDTWVKYCRGGVLVDITALQYIRGLVLLRDRWLESEGD